MKLFKGIPVSPGVAIGRVYLLDDERRKIVRRVVAQEDVRAELDRFQAAVRGSVAELVAQRDETERELGAEAAKVFAFHIGMLGDKALLGPIREEVQGRLCAEAAVAKIFGGLRARFLAMGEAAFRTKVDDVVDLERRVLRRLIGAHAVSLQDVAYEAVVVARGLTPSQTVGLTKSRVIGFATDSGGSTSHTAIMARAVGLPAVVGLERLVDRVQEGDLVIVDGDHGLVITGPDEETLQQHREYIERKRAFQLSLDELADLPAETTDGVRVSLQGNIEFPHEAGAVTACGGEGVGLFRTEFLHLARGTMPTEEEHFEAYAQTVKALGGKPLTIRTQDLGSDKQIQGEEEPERNPALGRRSIRRSLQELPAFKLQLRAALRASDLGPVRLMFPLITSTLELRQAKAVLQDVMEDLEEEGIAYDKEIKVGMMIEVPAAAVMASVFADEADFFSIGTNDLVQYTLAVDRTNERVASLYTAAHPAVLRLVKDVVRAAKRRGTPVSLCGEVAGEPEFTMLLLGLGLRSLSVTPSLIPAIKRVIRSVDSTECERLAKKVGSFDSSRQVAAHLRDRARTIIPEAFDGRSGEGL